MSDEKIVNRDCINWSNNDHCAKTKSNYCVKDCKHYRVCGASPTTPASVASRLTDEDILELAHVEERYLDHKTSDLLRDYVRMRNDNAKLRVDADLYKGSSENWERKYRSAEARLDEVVKECEKVMFDRELKHQGIFFFVEIDGKKMPVLQSSICETVNAIPAILRAARGEGGAE